MRTVEGGGRGQWVGWSGAAAHPTAPASSARARAPTTLAEMLGCGLPIPTQAHGVPFCPCPPRVVLFSPLVFGVGFGFCSELHIEPQGVCRSCTSSRRVYVGTAHRAAGLTSELHIEPQGCCRRSLARAGFRQPWRKLRVPASVPGCGVTRAGLVARQRDVPQMVASRRTEGRVGEAGE